MSGHNKWSSIKHKKAAADAKRGKVFSRIGKELTLAARGGGGDPDTNVVLRSTIDAAKAANMPNDNIDRAIKKGTGELAGGALEELNYEGYAPGGVAILVNCLSDNRNRTAANVRAIFTKNNSSLAGSGAVAWLFNRKARFLVENADEESILEALLEAEIDPDEVSETGGGNIEVLSAPELFGDVKDALGEAGLSVEESGLAMVPENTVKVEEPSVARQVVRLVDTLEEEEDVQEVTANFEFTDEVIAALEND